MALRIIETITGKSLVNVDGIPVETGAETSFEVSEYVQIRDIKASKTEVAARVFFVNEESGSLVREQFYTFQPDLEGPNFIAQAYAHLKTLPEFADAEDC